MGFGLWFFPTIAFGVKVVRQKKNEIKMQDACYYSARVAGIKSVKSITRLIECDFSIQSWKVVFNKARDISVNY